MPLTTGQRAKAKQLLESGQLDPQNFLRRLRSGESFDDAIDNSFRTRLRTDIQRIGREAFDFEGMRQEFTEALKERGAKLLVDIPVSMVTTPVQALRHPIRTFSEQPLGCWSAMIPLTIFSLLLVKKVKNWKLSSRRKQKELRKPLDRPKESLNSTAESDLISPTHYELVADTQNHEGLKHNNGNRIYDTMKGLSRTIEHIWRLLTKSTLRKTLIGCVLCAIGLALLVDGCSHRTQWRIGTSGYLDPRIPEVFLGTLIFIPGGILVIKGAKEYWSE